MGLSKDECITAKWCRDMISVQPGRLPLPSLICSDVADSDRHSNLRFPCRRSGSEQRVQRPLCLCLGETWRRLSVTRVGTNERTGIAIFGHVRCFPPIRTYALRCGAARKLMWRVVKSSPLTSGAISVRSLARLAERLKCVCSTNS